MFWVMTWGKWDSLQGRKKWEENNFEEDAQTGKKLKNKVATFVETMSWKLELEFQKVNQSSPKCSIFP